MEEKPPKKSSIPDRNKPLQITSITHDSLKKLAKSHDRTMKDYITQMVDFFKKTGIDPLDIKAESSAAAIKALDKRLIGFIKTQEKEKLNPLLEELSILSKVLMKKTEGMISKDYFIEVAKRLNDNQQVVLKESKLAIESSKEEIKSLQIGLETELKKIKEIIDSKLGKKGLF